MARRTRLNWRLLLLAGVLSAGALAVVVRMAQVQILDHDYYAARAQEEHLHRTVIRAPRGAILDRNGFPLATTVDTFDVYVDPRSWDDGPTARGSAQTLAPLIGRRPAELIAATGAETEGDYLAAQSVSAETGLKLVELGPPGVKMVNTSKRFYPEGDLASVVLGFIGRDQEGLAGVEADFDRELGGVPGEVYYERDGLGNPIPFGRRLGDEPVPGGDVYLTIDRYLQMLAERELDGAVAQYGASGGTILVMDPWTGEVLAMASRPSFRLSELNLNDPAQVELYRNRAATDVYPPGSVTKTMTVAAAIDAGLVKPDSTYFDDGSAEVEGGTVIHNWDFSAHGTTTVTQVLQYSVNTGAVWLSSLLGPPRFYDYLSRFGFGEPADIGVGGEPAGIVRTHRAEGWYPVDLASNSFGQGMAATPVQVLTAASALVNGGLLMRPYIVKEVGGPDGHRVLEPVVVRRVISEETSQALVEMMHAVVDGMPGHLAQVPGVSVGGKTGTTTFPGQANTIASFVGFAPVESPRFIMLVKIDMPQGDSLGGIVAAPLFAHLAPQILAYLGARPEEPVLAEGAPVP